MKSMRAFLFLSLFCKVAVVDAQITPPGFEREVRAMEERKRTSILDQDSVMVIDTITLFDPTTYVETMQIVRSHLSWRDYLMLRLGISQPDILLNGNPLNVTDPNTYEKITVQWNASSTKLDTLRQH